jgi:hypothetical protein
MMDTKVYYIVSTAGVIVGGYVPMLFGVDSLSAWSVLSGAVGGILAIVVVYNISQ